MGVGDQGGPRGMGVFERGLEQEQKLTGPGAGGAASAVARGMLRCSCRMCSSRFQAPRQALGCKQAGVSAMSRHTRTWGWGLWATAHWCK